MLSNPEKRVQELHLTLPPAPKPVAKYRTAVRQGDLLYVSGHGPLHPDGTLTKGRVGADLSPEQGYQAARQTGLAILATLREMAATVPGLVPPPLLSRLVAGGCRGRKSGAGFYRYGGPAPVVNKSALPRPVVAKPAHDTRRQEVVHAGIRQWHVILQ